MVKLFPIFSLGGKKESGISVVPEESRKNKKGEFFSSDRKRKFQVELFYQYGDPAQPIQSVRLAAEISPGSSWATVMTIERSIRDDVAHSYIYFEVPLGKQEGFTYGVLGGYGANGELYVEEFPGSRGWRSMGPDSPEVALLFSAEQLPTQIDTLKTSEAFLQQFQLAVADPDVKHFHKPVLFPFTHGDIADIPLPFLPS